MDAKHQPLKERIKGDLYVVMQKDKFHRFFTQNQYKQKNKLLQSDIPHQNRNKMRPKTTTTLPQQSIQIKINELGRRKIKRKMSEVSIVQDFQNEQKQPKQQRGLFEQRYSNDLQRCRRIQYPNDQVELEKQKKQMNKRCNQTEEFNPVKSKQNKNFKAFFQYILEFKLMKGNSYNSKANDNSILNIDSSLSPRIYKSSKSFKVHFQQNEAEKKQLEKEQFKSEVNENKQKPKNQLQVSQMSLVDVRISNTSFDDFTTPVKNIPKGNYSSPNNQMKKNKKVFFDFQNPNQTSLDEADQLDIMISDQKAGSTLYRSEGRIVSFNQLKRRMQNIEHQAKNFIHHGYFCDQCKADPIIGRRYRCLQCDQYDLCGRCYQNECSNYKMIMNKYQKQKKNPRSEQSKIKFSHIVQMSPMMMRKKMSDIKEEESPSQNHSSEEGLHVSSQNGTSQNQHVHLMQEVLKSRPQFQLNLQKALKQTNRLSNDSLTIKISNRNSEKPLRGLSPLTPQYSRAKLVNNIGNPRFKLAFSERTIPIKQLESTQRNFLESSRLKVELLKKKSQELNKSLT